MGTRGLWVAGLVAFGCFGLVSDVSAEEGDMAIRLSALYSAPTGDLVDGNQTTELEEAVGLQASFEYRISNLIGFEPVLETLNYDISVSEPGVPELDLGEIDVFSVRANLNFHVLDGDRVELYIGPTVGYSFWGDLESDVFQQDFATGDELIYGAVLGIDVAFGKSDWQFSGGLSYLLSEFGVDNNSGQPDIGVDPLQVSAGISYRF